MTPATLLRSPGYIGFYKIVKIYKGLDLWIAWSQECTERALKTSLRTFPSLRSLCQMQSPAWLLWSWLWLAKLPTLTLHKREHLNTKITKPGKSYDPPPLILCLTRVQGFQSECACNVDWLLDRRHAIRPSFRVVLRRHYDCPFWWQCHGCSQAALCPRRSTLTAWPMSSGSTLWWKRSLSALVNVHKQWNLSPPDSGAALPFASNLILLSCAETVVTEVELAVSNLLESFSGQHSRVNFGAKLFNFCKI